MKSKLPRIFLLAVTACAPSPTPGSSAATPIFREIDIRPYGVIALGKPFTQRVGIGKEVRPRLFVLDVPGAQFADTDSILVELDGSDRVIALHFVYQAGKDYGASVNGYEESLGAPTARTSADSVGGKVDRVVWEDADTRFELSRFRHPSRQPRIASVLADRATVR